MAKLDYALLGEYARVDAAGLLTVVGAGFVKVSASQFPAHQPVGIALRLILAEDEKSVPWSITWRDPSGLSARMESVAQMPDADSVLIDGEVAVPVALNVTLPIMREGIFTITVEVDGEERATLRFKVVSDSSAQE